MDGLNGAGWSEWSKWTSIPPMRFDQEASVYGEKNQRGKIVAVLASRKSRKTYDTKKNYVVNKKYILPLHLNQ